MKVTVVPNKNIFTCISVPPSKSIAHRLVIGACLAKGESKISNVDLSRDIKATINCMSKLKADIAYKDKQLIINGSINRLSEEVVLNADESGSTLRFLIPLFALSDQKVIFKGEGRLLKRPLSVYEDIFKKQNLLFDLKQDGLHIKGPLKPGVFELSGDVSSQFITGLLFALPLLKEDSVIKIKPPFESESYVDITLDILKQFNIRIDKQDDLTYYVYKNQQYSNGEYHIEGDFSQMSFFLALGLLNNGIKITGLNKHSRQGDKAIVDIAKMMNGKVTDDFSCLKSDLKGATIDLHDVPDLGPIIMAMATQAEGKTHLLNAGRLRIKESDRISAMEMELKKLGCKISSTYDEVFIEGKTKIGGKVVLDSHNDHRIVMALSILASIAEKEVTIKNAEAINKSYPDFFNDLRKTGIEVKEDDI